MRSINRCPTGAPLTDSNFSVPVRPRLLAGARAKAFEYAHLALLAAVVCVFHKHSKTRRDWDTGKLDLEARPRSAPFGGKFIARGGNLAVLEGEWVHPRLVIIEFPTRRAAEDWYWSEAYRKIIDLRLKSTSGNLVIIDGTP